MEKHEMTNREHTLLDKFIDKYIDGYKENKFSKVDVRGAFAHVIPLMQNSGAHSVVKHIEADLIKDASDF